VLIFASRIVAGAGTPELELQRGDGWPMTRCRCQSLNFKMLFVHRAVCLPVGRIDCIVISNAVFLPALFVPEKSVRDDGNFARRFKLIGPSRWARKNIPISYFRKS
jgi:hypothetical protein